MRPRLDPPPASLARFRPTVVQAAARGAYLGLIGAIAVIAGGALAGVLLGVIGGPEPDDAGLTGGNVPAGPAMVAVVAVAATGAGVGAALGLIAGRESGVDVDDLGLRRVPADPTRWPPPLAPWERIMDIRAERRGSRTIVAVYLDTGVVQRLSAPYDGRLLAHDPEFEWKLFTLRNLWETHRTWGPR